MESTNDDKDVEEEEEEILVYANFEDGTVDKSIFLEPDFKFKIIGLDSDTPIVQLGDSTFKGAWNEAMGTKVIFEEDPSPEQVDPVFTVTPSKMLKYKCKTTKTLELSRIFLKPKHPEGSSRLEEMDTNGEEDMQVGEEEDVLDLAQSTLYPDSSTDDVMREIVEDSTLDITEQDMLSEENINSAC